MRSGELPPRRDVGARHPGKSTLLRLLNRLADPGRGTVEAPAAVPDGRDRACACCCATRFRRLRSLPLNPMSPPPSPRLAHGKAPSSRSYCLATQRRVYQGPMTAARGPRPGGFLAASDDSALSRPPSGSCAGRTRPPGAAPLARRARLCGSGNCPFAGRLEPPPQSGWRQVRPKARVRCFGRSEARVCPTRWPTDRQERQNPAARAGLASTATGIRTPVSAVRGRRPSPLDDGGSPVGDCSDGLAVRGGAGVCLPGSSTGGRGKSGAKPARSRHCERALMRR